MAGRGSLELGRLVAREERLLDTLGGRGEDTGLATSTSSEASDKCGSEVSGATLPHGPRHNGDTASGRHEREQRQHRDRHLQHGVQQRGESGDVQSYVRMYASRPRSQHKPLRPVSEGHSSHDCSLLSPATIRVARIQTGAGTLQLISCLLRQFKTIHRKYLERLTHYLLYTPVQY